MDTNSKYILVVGYYGFENAGDELLLKKTIHLLKEFIPGSQICVLHKGFRKISRTTISPLIRKATYPDTFPKDITFCKRTSVLSILKAVISSSIIVNGGGGILQDKTSQKSLFYYLSILLLAVVLRKKTLLLAQGTGPFNHTLSKWLVSKVLNLTDCISVRDNASYRILKDLKIKENKIIQAADLAFYNTETSEVLPDAPEAIGLSLRKLDIPGAVRNSLDDFFSKKNNRFIFLDFHKKVDFEYMQTFQKIPGYIEKTLDMQNYLVNQEPLPYSFTMIIAMRYHACVWAALHGIPFLALIYDEKVLSISREFKQEYVDLRKPDHNRNTILIKYSKVMKNYRKYSSNIQDNLPSIIERAKNNISVFNGL
ncbi:MAG: hypothetical protein GY730_03300 [bacterium]|nr:hypothetical protein [bacterium]